MLGTWSCSSASVELAITTLALRERLCPAHGDFTDQDPECNLDCIPSVGRPSRFQTGAQRLVAFGGHLAAIAVRRWNHGATGFAYPEKWLGARMPLQL